MISLIRGGWGVKNLGKPTDVIVERSPSESDEQAGMDTDCDEAATTGALETDNGEKRVSARLAALAARL